MDDDDPGDATTFEGTGPLQAAQEIARALDQKKLADTGRCPTCGSYQTTVEIDTSKPQLYLKKRRNFKLLGWELELNLYRRELPAVLRFGSPQWQADTRRLMAEGANVGTTIHRGGTVVHWASKDGHRWVRAVRRD